MHATRDEVGLNGGVYSGPILVWDAAGFRTVIVEFKGTIYCNYINTLRVTRGLNRCFVVVVFV